MPFLTGGLILGVLIYSVSGLLGIIYFNFTILLFVVMVLAGIYWVGEKWLYKARGEFDAVVLKGGARPWWLECTAGLFPVITVVFLVRSFIVEPFHVPSGSMMPTLLIGDYILVSKFDYGLRVPILNFKLIEGQPVKPGDVLVFKSPIDNGIDLVKRVVAVSGDRIVYEGRKLSINGKELEQRQLSDFADSSMSEALSHFMEGSGSVAHGILINTSMPAIISSAQRLPPEQASYCEIQPNKMSCIVPDSHYFVMGDNRDNSFDSRYWGFVPDENIVGKALWVWANFSHLGRMALL